MAREEIWPEINQKYSYSGWHGPDPKKLCAIEFVEASTSKTNLQSALGLFNCYRDYIKNYVEVAKPLTDLPKRKFQRKRKRKY